MAATGLGWGLGREQSEDFLTNICAAGPERHMTTTGIVGIPRVLSFFSKKNLKMISPALSFFFNVNLYFC